MGKRAYKYIVILLIYTATSAGAQTDSAAGFFQGWQLYHSEGEITITQSGVRTTYRAGMEGSGEIILKPKDMIQTGKGTAEIQLIINASADKPPSPDKTYSIIKMSENTSLMIERQESKEITVDLLYGRARVVTGTVEPGIVFRIGASVTTLRNCDMAIDYIIKPGVTQPVLSLHCYYGQGEIIPRYAPGTEPAKFPLKADETFSLEYRVPYSYMERKQLDSQILAYWQSNPFASDAPLPMPQGAPKTTQDGTLAGSQTGTPAGAPAAGPTGSNDLAQTDGPLQPGNLPEVKQSRGISVPGLIAGLLLAAGGGALLAYSQFGNPDKNLKTPLFYGSFAPIGLGTLFIIGSIINPPINPTE